MNIKISVPRTADLLKKYGLEKDGAVQQYMTNMVNRRITRYMPYRTGVLSSKLKFVSGPREITVVGPYARYQYGGKVMIDPTINAAGFRTKDGTWRSRRGAVKVLTDRSLSYDTSKNEFAGPLWDKALVAHEADDMTQELANFIRSRGG